MKTLLIILLVLIIVNLIYLNYQVYELTEFMERSRIFYRAIADDIEDLWIAVFGR